MPSKSLPSWEAILHRTVFPHHEPFNWLCRNTFFFKLDIYLVLFSDQGIQILNYYINQNLKKVSLKKTGGCVYYKFSMRSLNFCSIAKMVNVEVFCTEIKTAQESAYQRKCSRTLSSECSPLPQP